MIAMIRLLVIHGPNLNLLGSREPHIYGSQTLAEIDQSLLEVGEALGVELEFFQSNIEGEIVTTVQDASGSFDGLLINAGGYTHTSVAIRDALAATDVPAVEVHLTNTQAREEFRAISMLGPVVYGRVEGFGAESYHMAMHGLVKSLRRKKG